MSKKQVTLLIMIIASISVIAVTGSLAFLTAKTAPVVNTFTSASDLVSGTFTVEEHKADTKEDGSIFLDMEADTVSANSYTVLPGATIPKDPFVSIDGKTSTPSYLYITVDKSGFSDKLVATVDSAKWTKIAEANGVTLYAYNGGTAAPVIIDDSFGTDGTGTVSVLSGNKVTLADADDAADIEATLSIKAYLAQASAGTGATPAAKAEAAFDACFPGTKPVD